MALRIDATNPEHLKVRFALPAGDPPGHVSVVGTFNDWTAGLDELVDDGRGLRVVVLGLPYGCRQVFRYLAEGPRWFDDPDADEFTAEGSVLYAVERRPPSASGST